GGFGRRRSDRPAPGVVALHPLVGGAALLRRAAEWDADLDADLRLDGVALRGPARVPLAAPVDRRGVLPRHPGDVLPLGLADGARAPRAQMAEPVQAPPVPLAQGGGPERRPLQRRAEDLLLP